MKKLVFSFLIWFLSIFPSGYCSFELILLHNSDIRGMLDQTTKRYAYCLEEDKLNKECVGGLPRIISLVESFRKSKKNVMYLFAGNICHGSVWFSMAGPPVVYELMNVLKPDAVALGTYEFVDGEEKLTEYVSNLNTQILSANLDLKNAPELKKYIKPWTIIEKDGHKIGVIGYTSMTTPRLSGKLPRIDFEEVVTSIKLASEELAEQGANIQIVIGDGGFDIDRDIAMLAPTVDVVVGANQMKLLYNGNRQPCIEKIEGGYPFVVKSLHNRQVPLAYTYKFSKYMGRLNLTFDDDGKLIEWSGQPIYLNNSLPQDERAVEILDKYRPKVEGYQHSTLATGKVLLEGDTVCRIRECNFGNLLADSLVHHAVKHLTPENSAEWSSASISLVSGRDIYGHLDFLHSHQNITVHNLSSVIPFKSNLVTFRINGERIMKALATAIGVDVTANQDEISDHETFQLEFDWSTKRWYIRTMQDKYWTLETGGGIQASGDKRSSNALFDLVWQGDGSVAFRANNGRYVMTKRSGHLYATSDTIDDNCKYFFYLVNRPILVLKCEQGFVGYKSAGSPKLECNKATYETIQVERAEKGVVYFKGQNNKYWHVDSEGVTADSDTPEGFYLELREPTRLCIKTVNGNYLTASKNGCFRLGDTSVENATQWEY